MRLLFVGLMMLATYAGGAAAYTYAGLGTGSCRGWTEARRLDRASIPYEQWVLGFLSGVVDTRFANFDPFTTTDAAMVLAWIDRHCRLNPADTIVIATRTFIVEEIRRTPGR
jgi:hypothetical protein